MKHLEGQGEFPVSVRRLAANRSVPACVFCIAFRLVECTQNGQCLEEWVGGLTRDVRMNEWMDATFPVSYRSTVKRNRNTAPKASFDINQGQGRTNPWRQAASRLEYSAAK